MRALPFLFLPVFLMGALTVPDRNKWVIDPASQIVIHGYTNVNQFKCSLNTYNGYDTLEYVIGKESNDMIFLRNQMIVPVRDFGCGNAHITSDFQQTLKASEYPYIRIRLLSLSANDQVLHNIKKVTGRVAITIAGVTKKYELLYTVRNDSLENIRLEGMQSICFSDYHLKTPSKMLGLIQVQEDLHVEFLLQLRPL